MINYTWNISRLDCAPSENGLTNVVKVINWGLTGIDENGTSASMSNLYPLPSPTPEGFTDYSTLTEETVIGWLESNLDVGYLQTVLANEIASKYNPHITPLPLPWIKAEPVIEIEGQLLTGNEDFVGGGLPLGRLSEEDSVQNSTASGSNSLANDANSIASDTLEVMTADGYKPNATDGDSDGMVQDSTKWERPIDSQL